MAEKDALKVNRIKQGVVIDGMPSFTSVLALDALGLPYDRPENESNNIIIPLMNVESKKLDRRKDILKIEGGDDLIRLIEKKDGALGLISEEITVYIIRDWEKTRKYHPAVPAEVKGLVNCPHYNCITHKPQESGSKDNYETKFRLISKKPLVLECAYCKTIVDSEKVLENMIL